MLIKFENIIFQKSHNIGKLLNLKTKDLMKKQLFGNTV
jgi:hypothetical protein